MPHPLFEVVSRNLQVIMYHYKCMVYVKVVAGTDTCFYFKCTHTVKVVTTADKKCFSAHNSSLEGATKLKFVPFCSP